MLAERFNVLENSKFNYEYVSHDLLKEDKSVEGMWITAIRNNFTPNIFLV